MRRTPLLAAALLGAAVLLLLWSRHDGRVAPSVERPPTADAPPPTTAAVDVDPPTLAAAGTAQAAAAPGADSANAESSHAEALCPLRLALVDAWDGRALGLEGVTINFRLHTNCVVDSQEATIDVVEIDREGSVPASSADLHPGESGWLSMRVDRDGYVAWESPTWSGFVARHARSALWVHPLHREALVRVHLFGPHGKPVRDARVARFRIDGRVAIARSDAGDPARVRGVPFLPGETLEIEAGWLPPEVAPDEAVVESLVEEGGGFAAIESVVLPESPRAETTAWINLPPRPEGTLPVLDRVEVDNDMPYEESFGSPDPAPTAVGTLRVVVLGRGGEPAAWVSVRLEGWECLSAQRADRDGVVVFEGVGVGSRTVTLEEPGRVPATVVADVREGETTEVVLREPSGAALSVQVVDDTGAGVRFPRVEVVAPGATYLEVVDGVQRLDSFADVHGRRTFRHVPPGEVTVRAVSGRRRGEATVVVREGGEHRVRVEVRPP